MNISATFIKRPVATSLLALAVALAGVLAFRLLPVSPLPQVEFPTIQVQAALPGASPETMASAVATPLERQFGRIAGLSEMTSMSQLGSTNITLQFDLNRNINAAARDVQASINAARGQLPANLPTNPFYRKSNPADAPIMILALTSDTIDRPHMYDAADSILAQKLSQIEGVGQVIVGGSARPAVRAEVNPMMLSKFGISLEQVRATLGTANANRPKGELAGATRAWRVDATDQLLTAAPYRSLIISYHDGAAVRLGDVADVVDSVENQRNAGIANGKPSVLIILFRLPDANIVDTVDRVRTILPLLQASISPSIHITVASDRTITIRASIRDIEFTLMVSVMLVILVVFIFLRNVWATIIPSIAVPVSLLGTFGVMYLLGYSVDNLSLMALTVSTGFVVDDAIVVIENITRYLEQGLSPVQAALHGAREVGFTVISMSTSLVAVFIPILLMGGIIGRLFREFSVTLAVAVVISMAVSLTTTPTMCAKFLKARERRSHNVLYRSSERGFNALLRGYDGCLSWVLRHQPLMLALTLITIGLNVSLYILIPKGFFPQQDTGRLNGSMLAAQDASFTATAQKMRQFIEIVQADPAIDSVAGFVGGNNAVNTGRMFIQLKPLSERKLRADEVIGRIRGKAARVTGATLFLQANQDIRVGGRPTSSQYQYTLQGDNLKDLNESAPLLLQKLQTLPQLRDVATDQQDRGLQSYLAIDRDTASRLGVTTQAIDDSLYDAFGQRQVSTIFTQLNEYHVVLEVDPKFQQTPEALKEVHVPTSSGRLVSLNTFAHYEPSNTALAVSHQGQFPAVTLSFNLAPGVSLGEAADAIQAAQRGIGMPASVHANFAGTAQAFESSLTSQPMLILAALIAVYIVLGVLYESYIHPITILSTLPSAGVGAILALLICHTEFSVIALIGIVLLIGIVKKNAIMMIDFALEAERKQGKSPEEAIHQACLLRFRPIMMTTMAAMLGGLPLALGRGEGSEFRSPLGITIVGGLIVSQMLTLFTTPVIYLYLDRLRLSLARFRGQRQQAGAYTASPQTNA